MSQQSTTTWYTTRSDAPQEGDGKLQQSLSCRFLLSLPPAAALPAVRALSPHQLLVRRALLSGKAARLAAGIPDHWGPEARFGALVLQLGPDLTACAEATDDAYLAVMNRGEVELPVLRLVTRPGLSDVQLIRVNTALVGHALFSGEPGQISRPGLEIYHARQAEFGRIWGLEFLHGTGGER